MSWPWSKPTIIPRELEAATYGSIPSWFNYSKEFKDRKQLFKIYDTGGLVSEAFDAYGLLCISPGYKVQADTELLEEDITMFLESISFDACAKSLITDALICGEGFQEKVRNRSGDILFIRRREPWTMKTVKDEYGTILRFELRLKEQTGTPDYIFKPNDIIYMSTQSLMERAWDDIKRDVKIVEASTEAIVRHGYKKYHVKVGREGETVPQTTMDKIGRKFEELKAKNEFITVKDVEINNIDEGATGDVTNYSNFTITRLSAALGVPEEILGMGRGSTEATANVRLRVFYDKIGYFQRVLARVYNNQLLVDYVKANKASIIFNDVSPIDNKSKAEYVAAVAGVNAVDPFLIMSRTEMRTALGLEDDGMDEDKTPEESEVIE